MRKFNVNNFFPGVIFALLLFVMCLEGWTDIRILKTFFKHVDELLVLGCYAYLALHIHYIFQKKWKLLYLWIGFMLLGLVSSLIFRYQKIIPAIMDAVVVINKFMVGYLTAYVYGRLHKKNIAACMAGTARMIAVAIFLIAVHDIILPPFFSKGDYRYFTHSLILMFPHQTYLAAAMVTLLILLGYTNENNRNLPYMLMVSFVGVMTLRGKAIAFFAVYWMLYTWIFVLKSRQLAAMLVGGGIGAVFIGFEQITDYFLTTTRYSPRQIMFKDSITLAIDHFPLGTGFGSFGSTIADQYYSPIYTKLGYNNNYGMGADDSMFLTDNFWPEIIAQFGLIGLVIFISVVVCLLLYSIKTLKGNVYAGFAMLMVLVNMLINSMAESSFFNPASFLLFIIFGLCEADGCSGIHVLKGNK